MKGKKTSPETVEEIKALSLVDSPDVISAKLAIPLRTVYHIMKKTDTPVIEAKREEKRVEIIDKVWADKEGEILKLKTKCDMILEGLNQEKVNKARLTELSTAYGTLFDKRRLIEGQSTQNISIHTIYKNLMEKRQVVLSELDNLKADGGDV